MMGTLTSSQDWTGREVNGVVLGEPSRTAVDANGDPTGEYVWDHPAIPGDVIDSEGDIWAEVDETSTEVSVARIEVDDAEAQAGPV